MPAKVGAAALAMLLGVVAAAAKAGPVTYQAIDLGATAGTDTEARGVNGGHQVGESGEQPVVWAGSDQSSEFFGGDFDAAHAIFGDLVAGSHRTPDNHDHATVWPSLGASPGHDLHPAGGTYSGSAALAIAANGVVGNARLGSTTNIHAAFWSRADDAGSFVDLNPSGFDESFGAAISPGHQAGSGFPGGMNVFHALLWSGTADSVVDLHPKGFAQSQAFGADGDSQVGIASTGSGIGHAMLWTGTADSARDLNPAGFSSSAALAAAGGRQVGFATPVQFDLGTHALIWSGTADSALDLHQFLPAEFFESEALGVDADGNIVGWAQIPNEGRHAILWVPQSGPPTIPLPAAAVPGLMTFVGGVIVVRRRGVQTTP